MTWQKSWCRWVRAIWWGCGCNRTPRWCLLHPVAVPKANSSPNVPFVLVGALLLTLAERHEKPMLAALERLSDLFAILDET